jgi:hypothetical protein
VFLVFFSWVQRFMVQGSRFRGSEVQGSEVQGFKVQGFRGSRFRGSRFRGSRFVGLWFRVVGGLGYVAGGGAGRVPVLQVSSTTADE